MSSAIRMRQSSQRCLRADLMAVRNEVDRRQADLLWQPVDGADGYVVRYGIERNKLYQSDMVYGKNALNINSLNVDPEYYFEVEAFSSGTPRYVENPFETRGRGAELDLIRRPTGGAQSTSRQMTYETYGKDEVYVFDGITPGSYTLNHTYGVGIWGPQQLTADQLIGTDTTTPTVTALDLTQFGNGSTQWGTVEVRVYPGPTSGRIEVTFHYTEHRVDQAITFEPLNGSALQGERDCELRPARALQRLGLLHRLRRHRHASPVQALAPSPPRSPAMRTTSPRGMCREASRSARRRRAAAWAAPCPRPWR